MTLSTVRQKKWICSFVLWKNHQLVRTITILSDLYIELYTSLMMPIQAILEYSLYLLLGMWNKFFQCLFNSVSDEKVFCLVAFFKRDLVKEMINIEFLPCNRIEDQTFFLVRKKTEFLTAKHWVSWLPMAQKSRRTASKKVNTDWQEKKFQIFLCVENYT